MINELTDNGVVWLSRHHAWFVFV